MLISGGGVLKYMSMIKMFFDYPSLIIITIVQEDVPDWIGESLVMLTGQWVFVLYLAALLRPPS